MGGDIKTHPFQKIVSLFNDDEKSSLTHKKNQRLFDRLADFVFQAGEKPSNSSLRGRLGTTEEELEPNLAGAGL